MLTRRGFCVCAFVLCLVSCLLPAAAWARGGPASWSAGTFAASPKDNRFALAFGLGHDSGVAAGLSFAGRFLGLEVLGGYAPVYVDLYDNSCGPNVWGACLKFGMDIQPVHSTILVVDAVVPLLCDGVVCLGLKGGYRQSSLFGHGGGAGLYAGVRRARDWVMASGSLGVTCYPGAADLLGENFGFAVFGLATPNATFGFNLVITIAPNHRRAPKAAPEIAALR
jgi:hypothetical protein